MLARSMIWKTFPVNYDFLCVPSDQLMMRGDSEGGQVYHIGMSKISSTKSHFFGSLKFVIHLLQFYIVLLLKLVVEE